MKTRNFKPGQKIAAIVVIAAAGISLAWFNPPSFLTLADANDFPAAQNLQAENTIASNVGQTTEPRALPDEPTRIVLENGKSVQWGELSEEDKAEIRKAMEEARIAIREAMEEMRMELNSEKMKEEMRQAQEDIRQAREEMRKAMAQVDAEFNSEEFRREMRQVREEIRKALQNVNETMKDEQFKNEMQELSKELQQVFEELNNFDWEEFGSNLNALFEEVGISMEVLGPTLNEVFENLNLEELFKEIEGEFEEN